MNIPICVLIIRKNGDKINWSEKEWQKVCGHCHSFYAKFVAIVLQIVVILAVAIVVNHSINVLGRLHPLLSSRRARRLFTGWLTRAR